MSEEMSSNPGPGKTKKRSASEKRLILFGALLGGVFSLITFIGYKMTAGGFANNFHRVTTYILTFIGGPFLGGLVAEIGIVQNTPKWLLYSFIGLLGLCFPLCLCSLSIMFLDQ